MRNLVILGSTGSIGRSTLDVVDSHPGRFRVSALAANSNIELLRQQFFKYRPEIVGVVDPDKGRELSALLSSESVKVAVGRDEVVKLAGESSADIVVNAIVGAAGLLASLETIKSGKMLALANKESLVTGGPLFPDLIAKHGGKILPIDSEHSAIWQAFSCGKPDEVKRIIITASGGPFRKLPIEKFDSITPEQALNHPTWKMGRKVTIDSATLVNKGLEVIEAVNLFELSPEKVSVVIHPQSIIHSMVEYIDSSIIAQLSQPDMRLPISYALFWPEREESQFGSLNLDDIVQLTFEKPDYERFPALKLAFDVARLGGTAPALFNAANEVAVEAFLEKSIPFNGIFETIKSVIDNVNVVSKPVLSDILEADSEARQQAKRMVEGIKCSP